MKDFFNRKTFDPVNNSIDAQTLKTLRTMGSHRLVLARGDHKREKARSMAMRWLNIGNVKSGVFIDLGCGNSGDCLVASKSGFTTAFGYDLFPPAYKHAEDFWVKADVVEKIPCADNSVDMAICAAMLDLVEPVAREQFFREVFRVLKPSGVFSCSIQWLQTGWGFDLAEEKERAIKVFGSIRKQTGGFIAVKGEQV